MSRRGAAGSVPPVSSRYRPSAETAPTTIPTGYQQKLVGGAAGRGAYAGGTGRGVYAGTECRRMLMASGQAVVSVVERFAVISETIGNANLDVKAEIFDACREARTTATAIDKLCALKNGTKSGDICNRSNVLRAAKSLVATVTRVLLIADTVVVKQLLLNKDKSLGRTFCQEDISNFAEFVAAFSEFGRYMIELSYANAAVDSVKFERRRAQISSGGRVLQRFSTLLHTSSKSTLSHCDCRYVRENRDTVFCQMRRAMDLIHFVVKDSVVDTLECVQTNSHDQAQLTEGDSMLSPSDDWDANQTLVRAIQRYESCVELSRVGSCHTVYRERLDALLELVCDRTQDFTDSPYTPHSGRQLILMQMRRTRLEFNQLVDISHNMEKRSSGSPCREYDDIVRRVVRSSQVLLQNCQSVALEQGGDLAKATSSHSNLLSSLKNSALSSQNTRLDQLAQRFSDCSDHVQEVCKLLRHISLTETLQISAKYSEINVTLVGRQLVAAAHALCLQPTSKVIKENFEAFAGVWLDLVSDVRAIHRSVSECIQRGGDTTKQQGGYHKSSENQVTFSNVDTEYPDNGVVSRSLPKLSDSTDDGTKEAWRECVEDEDNEMMRRAKNLHKMAVEMQQFTLGDGVLKNTQELFTQAEYFTEEANGLYKVIRQFSYQVPNGQLKKELLEFLEQLPNHVQQLQFVVKTPTVGRAATFTKVDNVICSTKASMESVDSVVNACLTCASKYNLLLQSAAEVTRTESPPQPPLPPPNPPPPQPLKAAVTAQYRSPAAAAAVTATAEDSSVDQYNLDFRGLNARGTGSQHRDSGEEMGLSSGSGANASQSGSSDPNILQLGMARRSKGDPRRTRVSFLLF